MAACNTQHSDSSNSDEDLCSLFHIKGNRPIQVDVVLEEETITMDLDTWAAASVMSKTQYDKLLRKQVKLERTARELHTYTRETVKPIGVCKLKVEYDQQSTRMPLYVLEGNGPALFGRNWLKQIRLTWSLTHIETKLTLEQLLDRHTNVCSPGLDCLRGPKANIALKQNSQPRFWKARPVALARRPAVERELDKLKRKGGETSTLQRMGRTNRDACQEERDGPCLW